jgi:hypothetical protein
VPINSKFLGLRHGRRSNENMLLFLPLMVLITFMGTTFPQIPKTENIPQPEFYGLYMLADGKLCGVDVDFNPCGKAFPTIDVTMGVRNGVGNVLNGEPPARTYTTKAIVFKSGVRFISYNTNAKDIISVIRFTPMFFVRRISIDTGWPNNVRRTGLENAWDTGDPSEMGGEWNKLNETTVPVSLLMKPLKSETVLGVPSRANYRRGFIA